MTTIVMQSSPFVARFGHRFGFAHHHKAGRRRSGSAFGPTWRFSTRFGMPGRCANLHQNAGHRATHLSRGDRTLLAFPRTQHRLPEVLTEQQLIAGTGHDPTPPLDLLGRAQVGLRPEQVLLEKAIAMFLREAFAIAGAYLLQLNLLVTGPDEPTLTRVAFAVASGFPQHADHTDFRLGRLAEMQAAPSRHHDPLVVLINPFPLGIGWAIGLRARALEERTMLTGRPTLLRLARGSHPIQLAIALEPNKRPTPNW
jgi:hypothetical protein